MTSGELRDQVATMLVAGHETTAVTLFWSCYLLASAPAAQERAAGGRGRGVGGGHGGLLRGGRTGVVRRWSHRAPAG